MVSSFDETVFLLSNDGEGSSEYSSEALVRAWEPTRLEHDFRGAGETDDGSDWERALWSDWNIDRSGSIRR
jgi:hypothetical protein